MHKNSSTPVNNTALWDYLGTKHLDFRRDVNTTPGVLIKEIQYILIPSNYGLSVYFFPVIFHPGN